ncbi:MAG: hypothetical protein V4604_07035 [Bacteroidota bacterium]
MVRHISRHEIANTKKLIGSELARLQQAIFDEETLRFYKDDNEEQLYLEQFDCIHNELIETEIYSKIIGLNHSDINTFTDELSIRLETLFQETGVTELVLIAHLKLDFFGNRTNDFHPLVNAYKQLEEIVGDSTFKEAFVIELNSLREFVEILFWSTRCDPSAAEYIFLFNSEETMQIYLCKYGNIHLTQFGVERLTDDFITASGWTIIDGPEYDHFSETGGLEDRQLKT